METNIICESVHSPIGMSDITFVYNKIDQAIFYFIFNNSNRM